MAAAAAPSGDEDFRVYTDTPRLLLRPARLKLLRRERDRQSDRWQRFAARVTGDLPEPGFARALYGIVAKDTAATKQAIEWALTPDADPRQVAIVYDWCSESMTDGQREAVVERLRPVASSRGDESMVSARNRAFAAVALATADPAVSEAALRDLVVNWWRVKTAPALVTGARTANAADLQALYETLHAVRDNLNIDLRDDALTWFRHLPEWHLLSHYPAPIESDGNAYFIPVYAGSGAPDLHLAVLSRIAGFSMVAYENNSQESQFLQGFLTLGRFSLRDGFGSPYEFLWANPYLPGLSYHHAPKLFHDPESGRLALRGSWDDDGTWFGLVGRELQMFKEGKSTVLRVVPGRKPLEIGPYHVEFGEPTGPVDIGTQEPGGIIYLGLPPGAVYSVQGMRDKLYTVAADRNGTVVIEYSSPVPPSIRVKRAQR